MKLPKRLLWTGCLLLTTFIVFAQDKNIDGRVTDTQTGDPLPDVTVSLKNSTTSTVTDPDGNFAIHSNSEDEIILVFTIVGYCLQ